MIRSEENSEDTGTSETSTSPKINTESPEDLHLFDFIVNAMLEMPLMDLMDETLTEEKFVLTTPVTTVLLLTNGDEADPEAVPGVDTDLEAVIVVPGQDLTEDVLELDHEATDPTQDQEVDPLTEADHLVPPLDLEPVPVLDPDLDHAKQT